MPELKLEPPKPVPPTYSLSGLTTEEVGAINLALYHVLRDRGYGSLYNAIFARVMSVVSGPRPTVVKE